MVLPKVAVVIINYNGRKYLELFLPSVLNSTYENKEVIVADNASTDDSLIFLKDNYPDVTVITLSRNFGFATGYNEALKLVTSDYYVLLNSDVEVERGWIEPVIELMENNKQIGACQPKILSYKHRDTFEYAGAAGGWLDCLGYPFAQGRIFDVCEKDHGQYDHTQPVFWASGAAMFVRAPLYHELQGLDGYFFAHMEEIDFCWRLQLEGFHVYVCPGSVVYHVGGGTLPKGNERKVFLNFRNNLIMLAKNLPYPQLFWKIPFRFLLDAVSAWKSLFAGQGIYFMAIGEAHLAFLKWVFWNRNQSVFPRQRRGQLDGWFRHSVAWKHFVRGKKTFIEIVGNKS
ncbi:MAG: glycosyltransferase family 2 protein [Bacteroidetes bacterium]|nr:glycosyltransferase family 2 protein [Bacteroidota bacterium]